MDDFTQLSSIHAVIDRARGCLSSDDLPYLVMSDPGVYGYLSAYGRVLAEGVPALLELHEGQPLYAGFDIGENLLLSHTDASKSARNRWFSILTAGIELLGWDGWEGPGWTKPSQSLRHLLTDSFALRDSGDARAPVDLLPALCVEAQAACSNRHERVSLLLSELLVASLGEEEIEAKCGTLLRWHEELQAWGDETGEPNHWHVERTELVWSSIVSDKKELHAWLELVRARFPSSPPIALEIRERLLREGAEWKKRPPKRS